MSPRINPDDPTMTFACPWCDYGGGVFERTGLPQIGEATYRCDDCSNTFEIYVRRESREHDFVPGATFTDDGLPTGMDDTTMQRVRKLREEGL